MADQHPDAVSVEIDTDTDQLHIQVPVGTSPAEVVRQILRAPAAQRAAGSQDRARPRRA